MRLNKNKIEPKGALIFQYPLLIKQQNGLRYLL